MSTTTAQATKTQVSSLNSVHISEILGRLGEDPKVKSTVNGKTYTEFVIAQNEDYGNQTNWITVVAWSDDKSEKNVQYTTSSLKKDSSRGDNEAES